MLSPDRDGSRRALLTVLEVADMLGCGRTLVYDLIGSRQLPVVKVGRLTRVPVAAVDAFVSQHLTRTVSFSPPLPSQPQLARSKATARGHGSWCSAGTALRGRFRSVTTCQTPHLFRPARGRHSFPPPLGLP